VFSLPSASKSALILSPCLRWAWSGAKEYEDEFADTTKRDNGTEFHRDMDDYYRKLSYARKHTAMVYQWAMNAIAWSQAHLEPRCVSIESEVYVASNFATGEVHHDPSVRDREYPDKPGFLPGTTDLVCVLEDGSLLVADWKTGKGTGAREQLLSLAWGLRKLPQYLREGLVRPVRLAALYISDSGEVHPHEWSVTNEELEAHALAMQFQLCDIGVRKEPVPGIHCTQLYCPHLAYCPGISATVESAAESPEGLLPEKSLVRKYSIATAPSSPQHAGSIMERVTAAKRQLAFYEARIKQYCIDGGKCIAGAFEYSKGKDGFRWREKK
jgi:hypothetical protein